jgi:hypothetical protein
MKRASRVLPPGEFSVPGGLETEQLCNVSYLRPVDGCPVYTEYFKQGDPRPSGTCTIHRGSLQQQVKRTVESLLRGLGSKIAGIFGRK